MSLTFHFRVTMEEKNGGLVLDLGVYEAVSHDVAIDKAKERYKNMVRRLECGVFEFRAVFTMDPKTAHERRKRAKRSELAVRDVLDDPPAGT